MTKRFTVTCLSILLSFMSYVGCSNETPLDPPGGLSDRQQAPSLPSTSTMLMDVSFFESAQVDQDAVEEGYLKAADLGAGQSFKLNFLNAAVRVLYLNVVVYSALVEPVAAFALAAHSVPQPQPDGSWLWTYIFVGGSAEYGIYLYGKQVGEYVEWRMEVSSTEASMPLDHFIWFEGQVQNDDSYGYWQFYEPEESVPAPAVSYAGEGLRTPGIQTIRIDWENVSSAEHSLVFLVNKPGVPEEGSTLTFSESPSLSSIDFYGTQDDISGNISWYPDGSGSIGWPDYRDGVKSCWDTLQYDTLCP